ncbi:TPA: hypothetical protein JA361_03085 [Legionella pneumophila]|nr:hypothetical protein [Legionella pneumophila]HAT8181374.1 hypothetical protein [Legionella pneumophila]
MPPSEQIKTFSESNKEFRKVLAGQVSVQDFFIKKEYEQSKNAFMGIYKQVLGVRMKDSMYQDENVAAAWIAKLRYNQEMTDEQFIQFIVRSEDIFKGKVSNLNLKASKAEENDLCAIMWGIEALNGIQSFDSGATRLRLPEGVAPRVVQALEKGGSVPRESTHATGTKLIDKGLGKDLEDENLRAFTPRGMGAILVIPTSPDGTGVVAKSSDKISSSIKREDYDLLLKREDYGYSDSTIHSRVHSKVGFINYLTQDREQYKKGMAHINNKSDLARSTENEFGKGEKIHRKEHLSELKGQSAVLVNLLEAGKKEGLFSDFKTTWAIRIKWPPWEKKIVSADPNSRKGLGDFLSQLAQEAAKPDSEFAKNNAKKLSQVRGLLEQAKQQQFGSFQQCREGNEVLVNCQSGKAMLVDNITKSTKNDPVNRESLVPLGMVSETNPENSLVNQQNFRARIDQLKENQHSEELQQQEQTKNESGPLVGSMH